MQPLLPLALQGAHTEDIEAFPSYLWRLASVHGVTIGTLLNRIACGTEHEAKLGAAVRASFLASLVRPNTTTATAVDLIAKGRAEHLYVLLRSTFGLLSPAIARTPTVYSREVRWCPGCLREQLLKPGVPYLKLAWFFSPVRSCKVHHVMLRNSCPNCGYMPRPMGGWPRFEICEFCDGRLDQISASDVRTLDPDEAANDLVALVGEIATASEPFPANAANRCIRDLLFDMESRGNHEADPGRARLREFCGRYSHDGVRISLLVARRVAFELDMSIADLLRGGRGVSLSFPFAASCPLPRSMRSARRNRITDPDAIVQKLSSFLYDADGTLSLREIARRLGVSVGAMNYHAPALVRQLSDRRMKYARAVRKAKKEAVIKVVREGVRHWHKKSVSPLAAKQLLRQLMEDTGLPKQMLRKAIQAELHADRTKKLPMRNTPAPAANPTAFYP